MGKTVNVWSWLSLWWYSRDLRLLLQGLPALVFAVGAITLFVCGAGLSQQDLDARYLDKAQEAKKNGDTKAEKTYLERVAYRGKERPDILFARAQNALKAGENAQGMMIMEQLAQLEKPGYSPAQMWWARFYLGPPNRTPPPSPESLAKAETCLLDALQGTDVEDAANTHGMLGELYLYRGQLGPAFDHLSKAVRTRPLYRWPLAQCLKLRNPNDVEGSHREAELVAAYLKAQVATNPKNLEARLQWAQVLLFLEAYQDGVDVLKEGLALQADQETRKAYGRPLGVIYAEWLVALERKGEPFDKLMERMKEGWNSAPDNPQLLKMLCTWARKPGPQGAAAMRVFVGRDGKPSAIGEMALGLVALENGDIDSAWLHLRLAHTAEPGNITITNNLAMAYTEGAKPKLDEALKLVNEVLESAVVKQNPNIVPILAGTRGHIYCLQKNWSDAYLDLRIAQAAQPNNLQHRLDLVVVCKELHQDAQAAYHQKEALLLAANRKIYNMFGIEINNRCWKEN